MKEIITLQHGSGGKLSSDLIKNIFYKNFNNEILLKAEDSASVKFNNIDILYTTDSYVITPIFFNGGDIGKLSICGTVNDLSVCGAIPQYISVGFIIEEGFEIENIEKITKSMTKTANEAGVQIVTGDTKVVPRGCADKIFINTSGIGLKNSNANLSSSRIEVGDVVILSGNMGDHGTSILIEREKLELESSIKSDCAPLNIVIKELIDKFKDGIKIMRDPTRGGVATTLNEFLDNNRFSIQIIEDKIPINEEVLGICNMLGMDPLYMANEGKFLMIVSNEIADEVLKFMKNFECSKEAAIIGNIIEVEGTEKVLLKTITSGNRIISKLTGDQLPRIC